MIKELMKKSQGRAERKTIKYSSGCYIKICCKFKGGHSHGACEAGTNIAPGQKEEEENKVKEEERYFCNATTYMYNFVRTYEPFWFKYAVCTVISGLNRVVREINEKFKDLRIGLPHCRGFTITLRNTTLGRSPLDG